MSSILTDDDIEVIEEAHKFEGENGWEYDHRAIVHAVIDATIAKLAGVSVEPVMKLADDYAELEAQRSYMEDQGTRTEMVYEYPALQSDAADARTALESAIATQLAAARVQALENAANHLSNLILEHPGDAVGTALQCEAAIRALIGK